MKKTYRILTALIITLTVINACKHEIPLSVPGSPTPIPGGTNEVCFETQILPLFQSNCAKSGCHDAASHNEDYVFDSYANIIKKGILPGNATNSDVYEVLFETGTKKMPRPPNPDLTTEQKALIGRWINEGAKNTVNCGSVCDTTKFKYSADISVLINNYCLGCHAGMAPSGGINLSTYNNVFTVATNGRLVGAVSHAPGYSPMPKNAAKLSSCQITQITKWVNSGAPNN
jgi:uncharacterized membrane protein